MIMTPLIKTSNSGAASLQIAVWILTALTTASAVFLVVALAADSSGGWFPGGAAFALLVSVALVGAMQAYLVTRAVAYGRGLVDGGRAWLQRRRELVAGPEAPRSVRTVGKRFAFAGLSMLDTRRSAAAGGVVAACALIGAAWAGPGDADRHLGLVLALLPTAAIVALAAAARAAAATVLVPGDAAACRRLVLLGSLPSPRPAPAPRDAVGVRGIVSGVVAPAPLLVASTAVAVAVLIASGNDSVAVGFALAVLVCHAGATTIALFTTSRAWWRDLRDGLDAEAAPRFAHGTLLPTPRLLVDIVTPLGPSAALDELGGVLSDHRDFVTAPYRWIVVTEPARVREVADYLGSLFALHGVTIDPSKLEVVASEDPLAGPKRNVGARRSLAPFIAFIDADDRVDLQRLAAAVDTALASDHGLQSVHLFPFHLQGARETKFQVPANTAMATITHHHCARLWPSGIFRSGFAAYPGGDFEDSLLLLEMATQLDHRFESSPETAFLTYADHRNESVRLTRAPKDATALLHRFACDIAEEHATPGQRKPSRREHALFHAVVNRVVAEAAWRHSPLADSLRSSLTALEPCRTRRPHLAVDPDHIAASLLDVGRRAESDAGDEFDAGLARFLLDELTARRPCTFSLASPGEHDGDAGRAADNDISLLVGLAAAEMDGLRHRDEAPTVLHNLTDDEHRRSQAGVGHFVRQPYFRVESDPSVPPGDVVIFDPRTGEGTNLGSFATDRLMSSRLLRLWDRFYPSINQLEMARAQIFFQSLALRSGPVRTVRLIGTGPSSSASVAPSQVDTDVVTICCNSWVRQPELMAQMGAKILTAADPIFHAGPSEYACQFRADVVHWLRLNPEHLFVTVGRDIGVYLAEFPVDVHGQVVAPVFEPTIEPSAPTRIERGRVQPYPNILTLLMLPLAELLQPEEVALFGFDGGAKQAQEFWGYDPQANYSEALQQTVREWHPEFFRLDYQDYRDTHDEHVAGWVDRLTGQGIAVTAAAPSNIPAIDAAYRRGEGTIGTQR